MPDPVAACPMPLRPCLAAFLALALIGTTARAATVRATLDRTTIEAGDTARLSIVTEEGVPSEPPVIPPVPNLSVAHLGQSSQFNFINGRSSSSVSHNYLVRPSQPGEYTIPAVRVNVDATTLTTAPIRLRVVARGATTPKPEATARGAFLRLVPEKQEVYIGEVLPLEIQLYARQGRIKQAPQLAQEGFTVGKLVAQPQTSSLVGGQYYNLLAFRSYVIAAKSGSLKLGPATMPFTLPHPNSRQNFFGEPVDWMDATLESDPVDIRVLPLPTNNVPPDFEGALGDYVLKAVASTNLVTAGDPITVTIQVAGKGPLESLSLGSLNQWRDFKVYPPNTRLETRDEFGLDGVKTFEQVVIPENASVKELPSIRLSFFDPARRTYRTTASPPIPITVRPAASAPAQPTVIASPAGGPERPKPSTDIVHIKTRPGPLALVTAPLIRQPWFVALQSLPFLAWIALLLNRRRLDHLARNPRILRRRAVNRLVHQGLTDLRRLAGGRESDAFFALLFRLLQEQLGERLDLPASAITEAILEERLRPQGTPDTLLAELHDLFQRCNQARYAPQSSAGELQALLPRIEAALTALARIAGPTPPA